MCSWSRGEICRWVGEFAGNAHLAIVRHYFFYPSQPTAKRRGKLGDPREFLGSDILSHYSKMHTLSKSCTSSFHHQTLLHAGSLGEAHPPSPSQHFHEATPLRGQEPSGTCKNNTCMNTIWGVCSRFADLTKPKRPEGRYGLVVQSPRLNPKHSMGLVHMPTLTPQGQPP